jgi:hypothetical protein
VRKLDRPLVSLPTLTRGAGARKAAKQVEDFEEDPATTFDFPAHWNAPDVRGALLAMHGHVCAFCVSELPRGDRGDVEHFRPKSLYFWLAYAFDNYLLSCSRCNRIFKREHFPLTARGRRVTYAEREALDVEERLFLDPATDPVEAWVALRAADLLFWEPAPALPAESLSWARVLATKDWFHWNSDPELVRARTDAIDEALALLEGGRVEEARRRACRYRPQGSAVRAFLSGLAAFELPTRTEEVTWLLEDLWDEWQWAKKLGGDLCEAKLEQLRWSFAVLWKAPPPDASVDVGSWLGDAGIRPEVEPVFRQL